jgi:ketosteroid isomerase-like protein
MKHKELIEKFYNAFSKGDYQTMIACYHKDIVFEDPAFGRLERDRAMSMWEMLLSQKNTKITISFTEPEVSANIGKTNWTAQYYFGKRPVFNDVTAQFKFKDGKIIEHIDTFNFWKWTRQALGLSGYLLGWTKFMEKKVQAITKSKLDKFIRGRS